MSYLASSRCPDFQSTQMVGQHGVELLEIVIGGIP